MSDEGRLVRCSPGDLSVEDIIDVRVFLDIAFFKGPDTVPRPLINWSFDQVILTSKEKSGLQVSVSIPTVTYVLGSRRSETAVPQYEGSLTERHGARVSDVGWYCVREIPQRNRASMEVLKSVRCTESAETTRRCW